MEEHVLPPDYPLIHARASIDCGVRMEGHLLTAGEQTILDQWKALSTDAAHVHARLCTRTRHPIRKDTFQPPISGSLDDALSELHRAGLVDFNGMIPKQTQLGTCKVGELRSFCKVLGLPQSGCKATLVNRLASASLSHVAFPPLIRIRHRQLFRRIHRTYLHDHDGDLTRVVLSDLGIQSMVQYRTTHGSGRFRNRRELCAYENALHCARQTFTDADLEETANNALQQLRKAALPSDHRWRFSAHRFWEQTVFRAARGLERSAQYRTAATIYRHALELPLRNHKDFAHRLALCLSRCDNPVEGIRICLEYADGQSNSYRLIRTGRRLARKACMEWTGHAVPPKPAASKLTLPYPLQGSKWITETGPQKIESAVIAHLRTHNRTAHHCENGLWTTLFGLLFADALFAPIPGMLPSPFLRAPLDLGTPEFQLRRQRTVDTILSAIEQGTAVKTLLRTIHQRYGQNIAGVSWYTHTPEFLCAVVDQVKPSALLFIMKQLLTEWSAAAKGLPDLVVLADDQDDPGTTHLPKELFLVEIKGPTDSLRDKQHWWITNLIASGVHTELWHVCPASG